jgi:hypothetical protein
MLHSVPVHSPQKEGTTNKKDVEPFLLFAIHGCHPRRGKKRENMRRESNDTVESKKSEEKKTNKQTPNPSQTEL